MGEYFYNNNADTAEHRLRGLEAIEDSSTIDLMKKLGVSTGWHCLEIGAGAGSIARWLADSVGSTGRVVATDIETRFLDSSAYEIWRHDIEHDDLPLEGFDLAHLRHVMIHVDAARHAVILQRLLKALKPGGVLLIEESDLSSWRSSSNTPDSLRMIFAAGVDATLSMYRSRGMNVTLGTQLDSLAREAGFAPTDVVRRERRAKGCSEEAMFHQASARQLAEQVRAPFPDVAAVLDRFAACLSDRGLEYETRATISLVAVKSKGP